MKANIHPDYHEITVVKPNGETFLTRSTYGKKGDKLVLDVSPETHAAWIGGAGNINEKAGKIQKFNNRFAGLSFGKKAAGGDAAEGKKDEKKDA